MATTHDSGTSGEPLGGGSPVSDGSFLLDKCLSAKPGEVIHNEYDEKGELIGFAMVMQGGKLPLTAQELFQLLHR